MAKILSRTAFVLLLLVFIDPGLSEACQVVYTPPCVGSTYPGRKKSTSNPSIEVPARDYYKPSPDYSMGWKGGLEPVSLVTEEGLPPAVFSEMELAYDTEEYTKLGSVPANAKLIPGISEVVLRYTPVEPLKPNAYYQLQVAGSCLYSFTTGDSPDLKAPLVTLSSSPWQDPRDPKKGGGEREKAWFFNPRISWGLFGPNSPAIFTPDFYKFRWLGSPFFEEHPESSLANWIGANLRSYSTDSSEVLMHFMVDEDVEIVEWELDVGGAGSSLNRMTPFGPLVGPNFRSASHKSKYMKSSFQGFCGRTPYFWNEWPDGVSTSAMDLKEDIADVSNYYGEAVLLRWLAVQDEMMSTGKLRFVSDFGYSGNVVHSRVLSVPTLPSVLEEPGWRVRVRARDGSGNTGDWTEWQQVRVHTTPLMERIGLLMSVNLKFTFAALMAAIILGVGFLIWRRRR